MDKCDLARTRTPRIARVYHMQDYLSNWILSQVDCTLERSKESQATFWVGLLESSWSFIWLPRTMLKYFQQCSEGHLHSGQFRRSILALQSCTRAWLSLNRKPRQFHMNWMWDVWTSYWYRYQNISCSAFWTSLEAMWSLYTKTLV